MVSFQTDVEQNKGRRVSNEIELSSMITAVVKLSDAEVQERITKLCKLAQAVYWELAQLLNEVIRRKLYVSWGYASFDDYCGRGLGFTERKGFYLVSVFRAIQQTALTMDDIKGVEWNKLQKLSKLAKVGVLKEPNKAREWIDTAKKHTAKDLDEKVKEELRKPSNPNAPSPDEPLTVLSFGLYPEQAKNVEEALSRAKIIAESDSRGHLLDCVCLAFNAESWSTKQHNVVKLCKDIERIFNVRIAVVSASGEILYGDVK